MAELDLSMDGRLEVHPFVNKAKIAAMSGLVSEAQRGGWGAAHARVRVGETLGTTDAAFSLAHLINMRNLEQYDLADRQWNKIATVETVDDFKPTTFYSLLPNFDALKYGKGNKGQPGVSPKVAEMDTYQYAYGYSEESQKIAIEKRGFKWGVSLEEIINDPSQQIRSIPGDMLTIALDTDEFLVFSSLQDGMAAAGSTRHLQAGTVPATGTAIVADAPFSGDAARLLLSQIAQRKVNNRAVGLATSYYVVVAIGMGEIIEAELERARSVIRITDGNVVYGAPSQGNLSRITGVIESEWITSETAWYLQPAAGTTRRKSLVKLQLAGRTSPEVLVNNFTGVPIGGGNGSDPFTLCHFDNDTVDLKLRQFTNSGTLNTDQAGWSTGLGE